MRKHKNKIIAGIMIAAVLALVFWWGGDAPGLRGRNPGPVPATVREAQTSLPPQTAAPGGMAEAEEKSGDNPEKKTDEPAAAENEPQNPDDTSMTVSENFVPAEETAENPTSQAERGDVSYSEESGMEIDDATGKDKYQTDPVSEGKPVPIEPENAVISDKELTCTLSIRCDTILENLGWLDEEKVKLVPKDGIIYPEQTVIFYEGESVFNLLLREMKRNKIHMEFENTPIYNSAYIEGIGNLYEFDCGELSGWMYKVNDWFPNYGCSRYQLKEGDKVEWVYTCDLGKDVGGSYGARNGR